MGGLFGLVVSTAYICLTSLIAWWARKLVDRICLKISVRKILLLEAVATWEMCAACFELIIVADNYGVSTYALYLFLLTIWWSKNWGDATACPYTHIEEYVEGKTWISHVFAKILCQLIGGLLTYRYVLFLWSLEVSSTHRGRAYEACTADLQVSAIMGAIIEGCATCICRVLSRALAEIQTKFGTELEAFIGTSLVVAAFNYSGGYFNPALATSLKYGCAGHSVPEHIFVYWIGSTAGAIASIYLYDIPTIKATVANYKVKAE